jgi:hypothetical protein
VRRPGIPVPNCLTWGGGRNDRRLFVVFFPHCWDRYFITDPWTFGSSLLGFYAAAAVSESRHLRWAFAGPVGRTPRPAKAAAGIECAPPSSGG